MSDGAVCVTASHLPKDRNGFKFYTPQGGFTRKSVLAMNRLASDFAQKWHDLESGMLPPTSGSEGVFCSEWVRLCFLLLHQYGHVCVCVLRVLRDSAVLLWS